MESSASNLLIVNRPEQLTVNWAQTVINHSVNKDIKNARIGNIGLVSVDIGTTTRVRLQVEHDGPGHLPKRWFVKFPSLSLRARAITSLPRLLPTEVKFYKALAPQIPVNTPRVLAAHSRFGQGSTLVINDVTETGAIPGNTGEALSADQATLVIERLAICHAHFMNKVDRDPSFLWLAGPIRRLEDGLGTALAVPLMSRGLRLAGDIVPPVLRKPALGYARNRKAVMKFLSAGAPTLVHHDCHPGNLLWQNGEPGFLDWQMVRIGEAISDISYFLATSVTPEVRRAHEMALLGRYHECLSANSPAAMDFAELFQRYRAHLSYPFEAMVVTLAVGGLMKLESNLEMIRRAAIAVQDHDSFGCLPRKA